MSKEKKRWKGGKSFKDNEREKEIGMNMSRGTERQKDRVGCEGRESSRDGWGMGERERERTRTDMDVRAIKRPRMGIWKEGK